MKRILYPFFLILWTVCVLYAQENFPCQGITTTVLNVRSGPGVGYQRKAQLQSGTHVIVQERIDKDWVKIKYDSKEGFVNSNYLKFSPLSSSTADTSSSSGSHRFPLTIGKILWFLISWGIKLCICYWIFRLLVRIFFFIARCLTVLFQLFSLPFFLLNTLQRYLAKPWIFFFKRNRYSNDTNERLRTVFSFLKIPLYIALTPLRLLNALFFNLAVHCTFEMFNYVMEVIYPSSEREGNGSFIKWPAMLPWRIIKYPLWHGALTMIESLFWTAVDIFLPTLTLFHGTTTAAADCIVASPGRGKYRYGDVGIWRVGGGNYAGDGIYFAPARSTAEHYSGGESLIICRVTLGSTIDLGLAPYHIFQACGHPNAHRATQWGFGKSFCNR